MTDLKTIQAHVGVPADGILGPATLAAIGKALGLAQAEVQKKGFDHALKIILQHEGGYVDHPEDPGGATNLGVTKATWEAWVEHPVTKDAIKALTVADVAPVYRKNYWDACRCDDLHPALALCVFDFAVNAGPGRAVRYLQSTVGAPQDGKIGPMTIAAADQLITDNGAAFVVKRYCDNRRAYYRQLSTFATFGKGWLRRVDETEAEARKLA